MGTVIEESLICHEICSYMSMYDKQCAGHISRAFYEMCSNDLAMVNVVASCGLYTIRDVPEKYWLPYLDIECPLIPTADKSSAIFMYNGCKYSFRLYQKNEVFLVRDTLMTLENGSLHYLTIQWSNYSEVKNKLLCNPNDHCVHKDFLQCCAFISAKKYEQTFTVVNIFMGHIIKNDSVICEPFYLTEECGTDYDTEVTQIKNDSGATIEEFINVIDSIMTNRMMSPHTIKMSGHIVSFFFVAKLQPINMKIMKEINIKLSSGQVTMYVNDTCNDSLTLNISFEQFSSLAIRMTCDDNYESLMKYVDASNIDHVLATMNTLESSNKKCMESLLTKKNMINRNNDKDF